MKFDVLDNFISPVTGRVLCDFNYILVGNAQGVAIPTSGLPIGTLPDLTFNKVWVGNASNRPEERPYIGDSTFVIRQTDAALPNAQVLSSLGLGLVKVIGSGYLTLAIANTDYATTEYLIYLSGRIELSFRAVTTSKDAAVVGALVAGTSSAEALASATAAEAAWRGVEEYIAILYGTGLNQLPCYGDVNIQGFRVINLKQSPEGDFDAVSFTFLDDLMHDRVEILWS